MYVYVYVYACMRVMYSCMHACTCAFVWKCTYIRISACMHVTYVDIYACMYACMHVCMHACTFFHSCAQFCFPPPKNKTLAVHHCKEEQPEGCNNNNNNILDGSSTTHAKAQRVAANRRKTSLFSHGMYVYIYFQGCATTRAVYVAQRVHGRCVCMASAMH
jgi:hypothetical protein